MQVHIEALGLIPSIHQPNMDLQMRKNIIIGKIVCYQVYLKMEDFILEDMKLELIQRDLQVVMN